MLKYNLAAIIVFAGLGHAAMAGGPIDFNRDIRPLLADTCFQCHGPDAKQRKADLRLDTPDGLASVVSKGKPAESELYRRITAADAKKRMPLASSGRRLSDRQIELIRRWIDEGATWRPHWAFVAPQRPAMPQIRNPKSPIRNPIDAFVLARLATAGSSPSPETDRTTLIRRVTLALTGLPPTPDEV